MKKSDFYELERKYREAPRKGWSVKGSRARANQTIEVNRQEVTRALLEAAGKDNPARPLARSENKALGPFVGATA